MREKNLKKDKIFCLIIFIILIFTTYMGFVFNEQIKVGTLKEIKTINKILLCIVAFILIFNEKKYIKKEIKTILILVIYALILKNLYLSFLIIIISKFINKSFRLKSFFYIFTFFYISVLILNSLGYLEFNNIKCEIRKFEEFKVFRHALGFYHPNAAMSLLLPIFSLLYYLYYLKYKKIVLGIILIISIVIFNLTFSRTTFILIFLFISLILINDKYIEKLKFLFLAEIFFIEFLTVYLPFYFQDTILNKFLSERLWLFHYYLTTQKITLFGNKLLGKEIIEKYPLDNTYLLILFENGILGFCLLTILIFIIMKILFENKDYKAIRIFSIILIFGFMESTALFYYFNIIYLIIPDYILKNIKIE